MNHNKEVEAWKEKFENIEKIVQSFAESSAELNKC